MSYVIAAPEYVAAAATDLANIGSALGDANSAALGPTSSVFAAGADEVSAAISALFNSHAQLYQALSTQAALFHQQFVNLMNGGASEYALTEAANAAPLQTVEQGVLQSLAAVMIVAPGPGKIGAASGWNADRLRAHLAGHRRSGTAGGGAGGAHGGSVVMRLLARSAPRSPTSGPPQLDRHPPAKCARLRPAC